MALVVLEDHPEEAREIIERALSTVGLTLKGYGPDGAYPEGYNYWGYGTTFQVLLNAALEPPWGLTAVSLRLKVFWLLPVLCSL